MNNNESKSFKNNDKVEPVYNRDGSIRKKMGRPPKINAIPKDTFERLCAIQCTLEEICAVLDISASTLEAWCKKTYNGQTFYKVFQSKRGCGKASLRRSQFEAAERGNPTMLVWLGKNYLGQSDNPNNYDDSGSEEDALTKSLRELGENL